MTLQRSFRLLIISGLTLLVLFVCFWILIIWSIPANLNPIINLRNTYDEILYKLQKSTNLSDYSIGILSPEQIVVKRWIKDKGVYMYRLNGEYVNAEYIGEEFYLSIRDNNNNLYKINIPTFTDITSNNEKYFYAGDIQNDNNVENMTRNKYVINDSLAINILGQHGDNILQVSVYWEDARNLNEIKKIINTKAIESSFVIFTREIVK